MTAGSVGLGLAACAGPSVSFVATAVAPSPSSTPPPSPRLSATAATTAPTAAPTASPSPTRSPNPTSDPAALRRAIARMLVVGFRGLQIRPTDPITKAIQAGLGGVILFDHDRITSTRNIASPAQLAALTAALRAAAPGRLLIAIDQEGGRISRLQSAKGFPTTQSEAEVGATGDPEAALAFGRAMGDTMAAGGIDFDLAPVVDVNVNPKNPAIGALGRSFSADPAVVAAMAEAEIRGLHEAGIRSAIKHFPGLGSASANSDLDRVDVTRTWSEAELVPFETLISLRLPDAVMTGHIVNDTIDPGVPASLSPATVTGLLRERLGWTGAVITDDLGAAAITLLHKQPEAVALAIEAGNDLLLFANQTVYVPDLAERLVDTIVKLVASGRISEARIAESVDRIDALTVGSAIE